MNFKTKDEMKKEILRVLIILLQLQKPNSTIGNLRLYECEKQKVFYYKTFSNLRKFIGGLL